MVRTRRTYICYLLLIYRYMSLPGGSDGKESAGNAEDLGSIPESGRSPGEGNGNSLQYSLPENSMDRGAWQAAVHGAAVGHTRTTHTFTFHGSESPESEPLDSQVTSYMHAYCSHLSHVFFIM